MAWLQSQCWACFRRASSSARIRACRTRLSASVADDGFRLLAFSCTHAWLNQQVPAPNGQEQQLKHVYWLTAVRCCMQWGPCVKPQVQWQPRMGQKCLSQGSSSVQHCHQPLSSRNCQERTMYERTLAAYRAGSSRSS